MKKIKQILITGGCGHVGSYVAQNLNEHSITIVDNFLTQRFCSLFNLVKPITFIEESIENLSVNFLKNFDVVYHSAAVVDAANSFQKTEDIEKININYTKTLIDKCNDAKISHFIFPSSTSVYGVANDWVDENDDKKYINPQSPYAESKYKIEQYIKENLESYTIFRFGTITGTSSGIRFQTAVNKFCYQAALGIPLTVWKENFEMFRPYLSLEDALQAIELSIEEEEVVSKNEIFNVLTKNHSLKNIINIISLYSPHKIQINWVNTPLLNQYNYTVSMRKLESNGFKSTGNIKLDIKNTINLLRNLK